MTSIAPADAALDPRRADLAGWMGPGDEEAPRRTPPGAPLESTCDRIAPACEVEDPGLKDTEDEDALWRTAPGALLHSSRDRAAFRRLAAKHQWYVLRAAVWQAVTVFPLLLIHAVVFNATRRFYTAHGGDPLETVELTALKWRLTVAERLPMTLVTTLQHLALAAVTVYWVGWCVVFVGGQRTRVVRWVGHLQNAAAVVMGLAGLLWPYSGAIGISLVITFVCWVLRGFAGAPNTPLAALFVRFFVPYMVAIVVLAYWAVPTFFAVGASSAEQLFIRLVVLPVITELVLQPVRIIGRALARQGHPAESPLLPFAVAMVTTFSTVSRLMMMTFNSVWTTTASVLIVSATEVLLRVTLSSRDELYNVLGGRKSWAEARAQSRRASSRLCVAEMRLVDQSSELSGTLVALELVLLFGLVEYSVAGVLGAVLLTAAQVAAEAATDLTPMMLALRYSDWSDTASLPWSPRWRAMGERTRRLVVNEVNLLEERVRLGGRFLVVYVLATHATMATSALYIVLRPNEYFCTSDTEGLLVEQAPCQTFD